MKHRLLIILLRARLAQLAGTIACCLGWHANTARSHFTAGECELLLIRYLPGMSCARCGRVDSAARVPDQHAGPAPWRCGCHNNPGSLYAIQASVRG